MVQPVPGIDDEGVDLRGDPPGRVAAVRGSVIEIEFDGPLPAINEALRCKQTGEEKCILFNFSGHGICDMASYDKFLGGHLEDYAYPQEKIEEALAELPVVA